MRAVVIRESGPPEVLEPAEVDEVMAGPGEAVIEVEFASGHPLAEQAVCDDVINLLSVIWYREAERSL